MTREILTDRRVGDKQMEDQRLGEYIVWIDIDHLLGHADEQKNKAQER